MTKTTRFLTPWVIAICAAACGERGAHSTLPVETRNDVLAHYMRGESLETIAREFRLAGRDDARDVVHDRMMLLSKRYYQEH